jgi:polar amino acid transport system permease protein
MSLEFKKNIFWYLCLIFILFMLGWGLKVATDSIEYKWYWNRVPQYFVFNGEIDQFARHEAKVTINYLDDTNSTVHLSYTDGTEESFKIVTATLDIIDDTVVEEGTRLGGTRVLTKGILIEGLLTTLELSVYAGIFGLIIGLFTGLGRVAKNPLAKGLSTIYVELIRGTPLLVQIFIFYYFLGTIMGMGRFTSGALALAIFAGAYVAEIIRAGIQAIHPGQMEAARSLGMNYVQAMVEVILPQAFKQTLPPLAGQFISLIKDSSLVSVIAITDLTKAGREVITSTFATFEIWFTVAAMYLILTFPLSMFVRYIERRFSSGD